MWWLCLYLFVIGLKGLFDLVVVVIVVEVLGMVYYGFEYIFEEGLDVLLEVIWYVEIYDVIIICVFMLMFLLVCWIKVMGVKMVLFGEGSDEIFGGYLYFYKVLNVCEFYEELVCKFDVFNNYDCLCVNKLMMVWGVELCVLFLDCEFFDVVMCIDVCYKMVGKGGDGVCWIEKVVLCEVFEGYLLELILWW